MSDKYSSYSPKEIAAFEGLFRLAGNGKSFSSIKVQDIASAAGIGKGTLYEYFSSKEEILSCAVLYALERVLVWLEEQLAAEKTLFQTLDSFLAELREEKLLPVSSLMALNSIVSEEQRRQLNQQNHDRLGQLFDRMKRCERSFFERGRLSGEIDAELDDSFCEYVVLSALFGMAAHCFAAQSVTCSECGKVQRMVDRALRPNG